jgi:hypothetical protein
MDDRDTIGAAYLAHLTEADLRELAHAAEVSAAQADARIQALRRAPGLLLDILDRPAVSARLLNLTSADPAQRFALISPFLTFAAAIHRIAADLRASGYAPERTTPRLRVPVFDGPQLAAYLEEPAHRLFLAELLSSFARSSSGVIVTQTSRGVRRRRWNDLDLGRLAMLLGALPEQDRPPVWRRLGDLALFLTGVFPAAIERALAGRLDPARLARSTGLAQPPASAAAPAELFEWLGAGWYRLAASHASGSAATMLARTALTAADQQPGHRPGDDPAASGPGERAAGDRPASDRPISDSRPASRLAGPDDRAAGDQLRTSGLAVPPWSAVATAMSDATAAAVLRDNAEHFHQARRVLNAAADRYLFPVAVDWFTPPA